MLRILHGVFFMLISQGLVSRVFRVERKVVQSSSELSRNGRSRTAILMKQDLLPRGFDDTISALAFRGLTGEYTAERLSLKLASCRFILSTRSTVPG